MACRPPTRRGLPRQAPPQVDGAFGAFEEFTNACRGLGAERDGSQLDADPHCGGQGVPLWIGSDSWMISQVLLDHDPEGRGERKHLMAAERARLKPFRGLSFIGELGSGDMWHR